MNKISIILASWVVSFSSYATTAFYTIDTNQYMSEPELAYECAKDYQGAATRLAEIAKRLSPNRPDVLSVSYFFEQTPIGASPSDPGVPSNPSVSYESKCVLVFDSEDSAFLIEASMPAHFEHLKKSEWNTACAPAYTRAMSNVNSPVSLLSQSWSLFQGRMCSVTTVEVKKLAE